MYRILKKKSRFICQDRENTNEAKQMTPVVVVDINGGNK